MSSHKWGESFLKNGLALEHLAVMALKSIGWSCEVHSEYLRINREVELKWFEHDIIGYSPESDEGDLQVLIECKYHDQSRFWFFLPCEIEDHLSQYGALSSGENLNTDSSVLHSAPYEVLAKPAAQTLLPLAPKSVWGVTVSQDGTRQPNAIEEATKQLGFGFVPFCLENFYGFHRKSAVCVLPAIVTSARLFRLRPEIDSLDKVRSASSPNEIADEVSWLWYYHAPNGELLDHNGVEIDAYKKKNRFSKHKRIAEQLLALWSSPHWFAIVSIEALPETLQVIYRQFSSLSKDFSGDRLIEGIWKDRDRKKRRRR